MYTYILNSMQLFILITLQFCSYLVTACSNMLDGLLSFLIATELQTSCAHERGWNTCNLVVDLPDHGKPLLQVKDLDTDHDFAMASMKPFFINKDYSPTFLHELLLDQPDPSDAQRHRGDKTDSNDQLIHGLGRDLSISCLVRCPRSEYGSIASLNHSCRSLVRSGALYKMRRLAGVVEYWVYYSCNLCEWEAFNPVRRQWMQLPKAGFNQCFVCSDKESLAVGTELLVFGREIYSHVVYKYSVQTNAWSVGTMTNKARCLFGSASMGAIGIVAGGCDVFGHCINSAELYDSEAGTWTNLPNMHKPRKMCSGVFMDGKFYVLAGIGEGGSTELTCGEEYDLEKKTWREIPGMFPAQNDGVGNRVSAASKSPPLLAVAKNELYAAYHAEQELRKYDKRRNSWATIGRLPENVSSMNGWGMAFRACGDKLVAIGGPSAAIGGIIEINAWEPNEGTPVQWELLGSKHSCNFVYNCAVMGC